MFRKLLDRFEAKICPPPNLQLESLWHKVLEQDPKTKALHPELFPEGTSLGIVDSYGSFVRLRYLIEPGKERSIHLREGDDGQITITDEGIYPR